MPRTDDLSQQSLRRRCVSNPQKHPNILEITPRWISRADSSFHMSSPSLLSGGSQRMPEKQASSVCGGFLDEVSLFEFSVFYRVRELAQAVWRLVENSLQI
mmetsp:Transcript_3244/g.7316  ORF Transcript_3244/g.7316 Transcript_3244/m.7316 type:complete len:101 (-) Transcript_3244:325-627(-)